jgi:hypothetical protein
MYTVQLGVAVEYIASARQATEGDTRYHRNTYE